IPLLPIEPKFWHPTNQKVKSTFGDYKYYNKIIEQTIEDLKAIKKFNEDGIKTNLLFLETCGKIIDSDYTKYSTKKRYINSIKSFSQFILYKFNKDDIQISSLTPELFEHFASFRKNQDNGGDNDIKYTISIIKSFIRKMDKRYEINLPNNFYNKIISIKSVEKKKKILSIDNFQKILNSPPLENKKIENARQIFLFSVFSNGLRFSDTATLRFCDFNVTNFKGKIEIRFLKTMKKTRKQINTLVNFKSILILAKFLPKDNLGLDDLLKLNHFMDAKQMVNDGFEHSEDLDKIKETLTINLENSILSRHYSSNEISVSVAELIPIREKYVQSLKLKYKKEGKDDVSIDILLSSNEDLKYFDALLDLVKKNVRMKIENRFKNEMNLDLEFYRIIAKIIDDCKLKKPLDFIFPLLKYEDFKDIPADGDFSYINDNQHTKMHNAINNTNYHLNEMCNILNIPKISTHFARHSFGTILIATKKDKDIDLYSLQKALGHTTIQQTMDYIQDLSNEGKDELTKRISDSI
ncbi:MAG: tyrosine-type recombinase/integrase, partial [Bacteroidota bacterium]